MSERALLDIGLAGCAGRPLPGDTSWNLLRGGPATLLTWLETHLGLPVPAVSHATRILECAAALERQASPSFAESFAADRWGTAEELLLRHDELRLAGWDGEDIPTLPPLVRDLAAVFRHTPLRQQDEAARLARLLAALDRGQRLPPHAILLRDPPERWPVRWQGLLARLTTRSPAPVAPAAAAPGALRSLQEAVLTGAAASIRSDRTLRWLRSRSVQAAAEAVAAALAEAPERLGETVICCEDPAALQVVDGCLARRGLPTAGAGRESVAHPVLQVLPLLLRLAWEPVDPGLLLDFVTLPVGPIPRRAGRRLAAALAKQPGLGSRAWNEAVAALTGPGEDPEGTLRGRLADWLEVPRPPWGAPLPAALAAERCGRVARWAAGWARALGARPDGDPALAEALERAAGQAAALGEMVALQGVAQSEPQLARLLDATLPQGLAVRSRIEAAGGPRLVSSLAEVTAPAARLVWLGLATIDQSPSRWSGAERRALLAAGIDLDDGSRALAARREAERRGLARIRESLLAVALPGDEEARPHPVWLQIRSALRAGEEREPVDLERLLTNQAALETEPWRFGRAVFRVVPPPPPRPLWTLPPALLRDRTRTSASELTSRLACPLQWLLRYAALLRPSDRAALPDDFRLKGTFGHDLLAVVAGPDGEPLSPEAAERALLEVFDARLRAEAAPLAQPARLAEALRLKRELAAAARNLSGTLRAGGYRIAGFEVEVAGTALGRELTGRIDCLARRADGAEAVLDFKYAGREKYRRLLAQGWAVQLATYAAARQAATGRLPAAAYLILADGLLYSPDGSAMRGLSGAQLVAGPDVGKTWAAFVAALGGAEEWLRTGEVPARPLQPSGAWPAGAEMVILEARSKQAEEREPCCYCEYGILCGLKKLT